MIVDKLRDYYASLATKEKQTGWPTGSRFGNCVASLQFKRFPDQSHPEQAKPRDMIRFEHGRIEEEWLDTKFKEILPGLHGLQQEPFYVRVPIAASSVDQLAADIKNRKIWGAVKEGFRVPAIEMGEHGKPKLRLMWCESCVKEGRRHKSWPCQKRLGFILDPTVPAIFAPTYVDWIIRIEDDLYVAEGKSMSNYGFRDVLMARLGWDRLAQLAGLADATNLSAIMVAERKETHHLVELVFSKLLTRKRVIITKLNGVSEDFALNDDDTPIELPADDEWDLAHVDNPFNTKLMDTIHENIRRVLMFRGDAGPGSKDVYRQHGPRFECQTCDGTGTQTRAKNTGFPLKNGSKPCADCNQTGKIEKAELGYPCSYCSVKKACMPMIEMVLDTKPHFYVERLAWEASGLDFTPLPYRS